MINIEGLLSARLFVAPQLVGERLYFVSNMSGRLSLYGMDHGGSVPEPLLPPGIALQNPHLMGGRSFVVLPRLGKIQVMIDRDGDEVYQPMLIPIEGGVPEPAFHNALAGYKVSCEQEDLEQNVVYLLAESRSEARNIAYRGNVESGEVVELRESKYGSFPAGNNEGHDKTVLIDALGLGDHIVYLKEDGREPRVLYGVPADERETGQEAPANSIGATYFVDSDRAVLFTTSLFSDSYGLGYLRLDRPGEAQPVTIEGTAHEGQGELDRLEEVGNGRYLVGYNIDGCSWLYEGEFDEGSLTMKLSRTLVGEGAVSNGVLESVQPEKGSGRYALSFSTATSPTQIYTLDRSGRPAQQTRERVLGIPAGWLSPGEDASFVSYDGLRISARLYLPAAALEFKGPRPVVYYIHGGPQSQERPDFAWFSMPLIQFLTMQGMAVFVPNVRGSSGYGFEYMKRVVRDWGGKDRLDHVHAMTEVLPRDGRLDVGRTGVVGRSYGGYMTLTLAARHPELWSAAVDMFGPYDLTTFSERIPETWKPFMAFLVGDPVTERDHLIERSPRTYIHQAECPMLVIQGKNDPRVIEQESRELVEELRNLGKDVEYLMFENEGHDVLKHENRVRCYNAIADFFKERLRP